MREPIDKDYSILGNDTKPEPGIRYTLPDGTKTIWLNEYVDGMVQAERERIIKMLEKQLADQNVGMFYADAIRASIKLIEEEQCLG